MVDAMKLYLENLGLINKANVKIDKITIVAGHNATGKSTLSKLIYSFLRANSINREEIAINDIYKLISEISRYVRRYVDRNEFNSFIFSNYLKHGDIEGFLNKYKQFRNLFFETADNFDIPNNQKEKLFNKFYEIDDLVSIIEKNQFPLYRELFKSLLSSEFSSSNFNSYIKIQDISDENAFDYTVNFKDYDFDLDDDAFKGNGNFMLNDVYYMDSVSILDMYDTFRSSINKEHIEHIEFLKKSIISKEKNSEFYSSKKYKNIKIIENEVNNIINGKFEFSDGKFNYITEDGSPYLMHNTSSGIKQIGIIQLLLANRMLREDCFIIIDEPEVNLHPEWQFKFANILVLIAKELDVSIYINTHSPLFIESINTFSKFYKLEKNTNFHLAEESEDIGKFNINTVESDNLFKIYDNLGKPYLKIDDIRISND